jgi:hypothetical protein
MAEVVDAIVADLIVRNLDKYEADFARATSAHEKFSRSTDKLKAQTFDLGAEGQKYKAGANAIGAAEEGLTQRVTRTRKARADTAVAQSNRETAAVKKAAKEQADAAIAEAQREAAETRRIREMVARSVASGGVKPGSRGSTGRLPNTSVPGERTGQRSIPLSALGADSSADVAAEAEINRLLVDQIKYRDARTYANAADKRIIDEKLGAMRLEQQLLRQGVSEQEIMNTLEQRALAIEVERAAVARGKGRGAFAKDAEQFARGGGLFAATGGAAAIAGIGVVGAVSATISGMVRATEVGLEYAKSIKQVSDQLGISAHDLQIWEVAAGQVGATTEQLREGFSQLGSNIGKAQEGAQEQGKIFKGLKIDLGNAKDGYKSLNDILPVFMDKLSKIPDQARRMALETALGGEQLRKLDPILSKGSGSFDELTKSIDATGTVLSNAEIQRADQTAMKLKMIGDQLQRQLTGVVASNSEAIDQLAASFGRLATKAIEAIAALQRFGANKVLDSDMASPEDRRAAQDLLKSTPDGRNALRVRYAQASNTIGNMARDPNTVVNLRGFGRVENTPKGRAAAMQFLGRETLAIDKADAAPPPAASGPDLSKLFAPKGPKGPKDKTNEREKRFIDEMNRLRDEQLRAQEDQTQDEHDRLDLKKKQLDADTQRQRDDIELQVKEKQLTREQADALEKQLKLTYNEQLNVIKRDDTLEALKRSYDTTVAIIDAKEEELRNQEVLAKTVAERAALEKQILEIERQKETLGANYTIERAAEGDTSVSTSDVNNAKRTLKTADQRQREGEAVIDAQNRGPLGDYLARLPSSVKQIDEALQQAAANGLQNLDDGLTSAVAKFLHLHGLAGQFLQDLIKIGIERELLIPLANTLFPQQGASAGLGGSGGGFFGSILSGIGHLFGGGGGGLGGINGTGVLMDMPGFATGVSGVFGGRHGTDNNILSLNGQPFARVNRGEPFAIGPNIGAANGRVNGPSNAMILHQTVNIDASGVNPEGYTKGILGIVQRETAAAIQQGNRQVLDAVPGTLSRTQTLKS